MALKSLATNKDVIVTKPDKGRIVVVLDRNTYVNKIDELISDRTKFELISAPVHRYTRKIEDKLNNFLRKIKDSIDCPSETFKKFFASGSGPGILYGLPKIHKHDFGTKFQFRPIFAAYNNPCFKLAKFISSVIMPFADNQYSVKNSATFVPQLKPYNRISDKLFMTSFDVESLYTNVPLTETIDIITNIVFPNQAQSFLGLNRLSFTKLLDIATRNCFFLFDKKLYRQCEGLGMGLPHSLVFANIFLAFHEEQWLTNCTAHFKPVLYRRYVDDTFVLFSDKSHAPLFLNYLKRQHNNINFTMETENDRSLSFLDVSVCRNADGFSTSVFRKLTFSGLGISFFSFCSKNFKSNSIMTLLHRAYNVCSSYSNLNS